jgi:arsenical pump membrane protein
VLGAPVAPTADAVLPMLAFLTAALTLAAQVESSGLATRVAGGLARAARGNGLGLYAGTCGLCAVLTAVVSLDGAVVVMVPVALALARECGAPLRALFAGVVVVANAASIAVPMGNPTNLVVMERLGLGDGEFVARMLAPALAAVLLCAGAIALRERVALRTGYRMPVDPGGRLSGAERHAAAALATAALAGWSAALLGAPPAWAFAAAAALALATARPLPRPRVPWRLTFTVTCALIVADALDVRISAPDTLALGDLLLVAAGVGAAAARVNNLPVSVCAAGLLGAGPAAYAALIGLGVGALATPHGSLATVLATDLAGERAPRLPVRRTVPLAIGGVALATVLLWAGG